MPVQIQLRNGTAAQWTAANPTLAAGEVGIESDTKKQKFGDGTTAWNSLGYAGTVTSVTGTSPVASSGGATPAISLASGYGDTQNPYASKTANQVLAAPNGTAGVPSFRALVSADIPTLNQNTTGTAAGLSSTLAIASGGTGQTTANTAFNALAPSQTSNSGKYLTTDGTNTSWATVSGGGSPGGTDTQVQYNSSGSFAGSANLTFNGTTLTAAGLAGPHNGTVGATTPNTGSFTTLAASSTVSGTGFSTYLASPPAIGGTAAAAGTFTTGSFSSTVHRGSSSGTVTMTAPAVAGTQSYTLPSALPTASGSVLSATTAGVMSWVAASTPANPPPTVEYLVVAGGGGGIAGGPGGGGGAGGYRTATGYSVTTATAYTATVGAGGPSATSGSPSSWNTSAVGGGATIQSAGGGGATSASPTGVSGGSGAGAWGSGGSGGSSISGGAGNTPSTTPSQGNRGGNNYNESGVGPTGGGGGIGGQGGDAVSGTSGNGGAGTNWNSLGTFYAGGGGGGIVTGTAGTGGSSIGGNGAVAAANAGSGVVNSGSGGGGAFTGAAGAGGKGIVIIRYVNTYDAATGTTGSPTITNTGGYRYYTFNDTGTITF
jgi:hypothetical protein